MILVCSFAKYLKDVKYITIFDYNFQSTDCPDGAKKPSKYSFECIYILYIHLAVESLPNAQTMLQ